MHPASQPQAKGSSAIRRVEDPRRALGSLGERLAAAHLERRGFRVIARNVRTRYGELDLIAFDGATLAFVEVKTRRSFSRVSRSRPPADGPLAALSSGKRARVRRLALAWLSEPARERPRAATIRFDAIGVVVDRGDSLVQLEHLEAAW